uniref:Uncharacterized protein n=1 Tax=Haplochromis burtoni TaxID=8153 RepID=A0A3Q3CGG8_HAPBU
MWAFGKSAESQSHLLRHRPPPPFSVSQRRGVEAGGRKSSDLHAHSEHVSCCQLSIHAFFDNVGWFTRKLSGILILLLLFAMGYFIQRIICPRPRRHPHHDRGEEPSLFHGHTSASQDSLLERYPEYNLGGFASPNLPAYDEVKYLPTYEESMQDMHRDRSGENLLSENESGGQGRGRATGPRSGDQRFPVKLRSSLSA